MHKFWYIYSAYITKFADIVSYQINNHQILSKTFGTALQLVFQHVIFLFGITSCNCAFYGLAFNNT